eukprot:s7866_g4.t1
MWRAPSVLRLRRCGVVLVLFMDRSFATRDDVFSTFCCEMLLCRAGLLSLRDSRSHQHSVLAAKHVLTIAMLRILCGAEVQDIIALDLDGRGVCKPGQDQLR